MTEEYPEFIKIIYTVKNEPCSVNGCTHQNDGVSLFSKRVENNHKIPFSKFKSGKVLDEDLKEKYTYKQYYHHDNYSKGILHKFTVYPIRIDLDDSDTEKMILAEQKTYERTIEELYKSEKEAVSLLQKQIHEVQKQYREKKDDLEKIREISMSDMIKLFSE
jgi:hypothetical protein